MPKYIDADKLTKFIEDGLNYKGPDPRKQFGHDAVEIMGEIYAMDAADVEPVRHGEWIGQGDGYADGAMVYDVWNCSRCDHCIDDGTVNPDLLPKYCPNCGAKMDGDADD